MKVVDVVMYFSVGSVHLETNIQLLSGDGTIRYRSEPVRTYGTTVQYGTVMYIKDEKDGTVPYSIV